MPKVMVSAGQFRLRLLCSPCGQLLPYPYVVFPGCVSVHGCALNYFLKNSTPKVFNTLPLSYEFHRNSYWGGAPG